MRNIPGRACLVCLTARLMSGCTTWWQDYCEGRNARKGATGSQVYYLYPDGGIPPKHDRNIPYPEAPLHVGRVFVPAGSGTTPGLSAVLHGLLVTGSWLPLHNRPRAVLLLAGGLVRQVAGQSGVWMSGSRRWLAERVIVDAPRYGAIAG